MKIFLVTEGDYSSYHVCAAFSTLEKAEKYDKQFIHGGNIEEYELDPIPEKVYIDKMKLWYVQMTKDGNVRHAYIVTPDGEVDDIHFPNSIEIRKNDSRAFFCTSVWARDKNHAIKIVNEKRIQYLASQMWKIG